MTVDIKESLKAIFDEQAQWMESSLIPQLESLAQRLETLEGIPRGEPAYRFPGLKAYSPGMRGDVGPEDRARVVKHLTALAEQSSSGPAVKAFLAEQRAPPQSGKVRIRECVGAVSMDLGEMQAPRNAKIRAFLGDRQVL